MENRDVDCGFGAEKREPPPSRMPLFVLLLLLPPYPNREPVPEFVVFAAGLVAEFKLFEKREVPLAEKRAAPSLFGKRDAASLLPKRDWPSLFEKRDAPSLLEKRDPVAFPLANPFERLPFALLPNGRRSLLPRLKLFPPARLP